MGLKFNKRLLFSAFENKTEFCLVIKRFIKRSAVSTLYYNLRSLAKKTTMLDYRGALKVASQL